VCTEVALDGGLEDELAGCTEVALVWGVGDELVVCM
jgi:hypothetical protein